MTRLRFFWPLSLRTPSRRRGVVVLSCLAFSLLTAAPAMAVEMIFAVTDEDQLLRVRSGAPGVSDGTVRLTGVPAAGTFLDMDFRPSDGSLVAAYRVGSSLMLYRIDPATGAVTRQGAGAVALGDPTITAAVSFDADLDRLRVITSDRRNLLVLPDNGSLAEEQTQVAYVAGDAGAGKVPRIAATTYRRPLSGGQGLLAIDVTNAALVRVGGLLAPPFPGGGELRTLSKVGFAIGAQASMDSSSTEAATYAAMTPEGESQSSLFSLNSPAGPLRYVGPFETRNTVVGIAVAPGGVHEFGASAYFAAERGGPATITLGRSGTPTSAASVGVSSLGGGGAEPGVDFAPLAAVVNYAPGQTDASVQVPVIADEVQEGPETIQLALNSPSGASGLGIRRTAFFTILDGPLTRTQAGPTVGGAGGRPTTSLAPDALSVALVAPVLGRLRTRLRVPYSCSATCRVTVQARLDGPTARRLKRSTFIGAGAATKSKPQGGSGTVTVKLTKRRGLSRLRRGRVRLTLRAWDARGQRVRALSVLTSVRVR